LNEQADTRQTEPKIGEVAPIRPGVTIFDPLAQYAAIYERISRQQGESWLRRAASGANNFAIIILVAALAGVGGWTARWWVSEEQRRAAATGVSPEAVVVMPKEVTIEAGEMHKITAESPGTYVVFQRVGLGLKAEQTGNKTCTISARKPGEYILQGYSAVSINGEAVPTPIGETLVRVIEPKEDK